MDYEPVLWRSPLSAEQVGALLDVIERVFPGGDSMDSGKTRWRIEHMPDFTCFGEADGARLIGFKAGYALKAGHYYSWLGGVDPDYLRRGIARRLMAAQHEWLREAGYTAVETDAVQSNVAMGTLNLASGFRVVGRRAKSHGLAIIYEKLL